MREKKLSVVFTFYTTADAMRMEKVCQQQNLPGRLIPAPRSVTSDCGIAWCAPIENREAFEAAESLPEFAGIFEREI